MLPVPAGSPREIREAVELSGTGVARLKAANKVGISVEYSILMVSAKRWENKIDDEGKKKKNNRGCTAAGTRRYLILTIVWSIR